MTFIRSYTLSLLAALLLAGCASAPEPKAQEPTTHAFDGLHWFRNSAERRAIFEQTYRLAFEAARAQSAGKERGAWAVILDVDETILDNSEYERRLVESGRAYHGDSWDAWVLEEAATLLPGAKEFIDRVRSELGGRIVLVTNRDQSLCAATEANLQRVGVAYDLILCDYEGKRDKTSRFKAVTEGTVGDGPLDVLLWIGDNIKDFPGLSQDDRGDPNAFGVRYFVLPNPMYGSWQSVPWK
jgi:5'-nucleotidase (lipoprotein e(P4) family)